MNQCVSEELEFDVYLTLSELFNYSLARRFDKEALCPTRPAGTQPL